MSAAAKRIEDDAAPSRPAPPLREIDVDAGSVQVGPPDGNRPEAKGPLPADEAPAARPATAPAPAAATPSPERAARKRRKPATTALMLAVPLAALIAGGWAWLAGGRWVSTDNAYVHQALIPLSADVSGRITEVDVVQNQTVKAGQVLFSLDPEPFRLALVRAEANVDQSLLIVAGLRAAYGVAQAQLDAAQQTLAIRRSEYDRQAELQQRGISTPAALDEAKLALHAAESQVALARQNVSLAGAALGGNPKTPTDRVPSVRSAMAEADAAARDLAHAEVRAPTDGVIAQVGNLNVGQYVAAGAMVVSLVASNDTWVEANFKETQIGNMKPGQKVELTVDAYPGLTLAGTVESFSGATGSQFSLIPAQNATGNWVKVVQRLPVRIRVTPDPAHPLRDGMSVGVAVDTGATRLERMLGK